jgi:hypothetical protein
LLVRHAQAVRQPRRHLDGGSPLVRLEFLDRDERAAGIAGKRRLGEVQGFAPAAQPLTKGRCLVHAR